MTPSDLHALLLARDSGRPMVLATNLADGGQILLPNQAAPEALQDAATSALARDRSHVATLGADRWFLHVHAPAHRLFIIGAVHIAQALAPMAASIGLAVTVIDPRRGFATSERFPETLLRHDWPDEALNTLRPDSRTAIVTLSHDPKLDDPALDHALRGEAFFIGALGSRKTHAARLERLKEAGHDEVSLARIRGPAGLAIGAVTAPEIALSILAELIAVRRGSALAAR